MELQAVVRDFAKAIMDVDKTRPRARAQRGGRQYKAGLGPFPEDKAVNLVSAQMAHNHPRRYSRYQLKVPYPNQARLKCDFCLGGAAPHWEWAVEVKVFRLLGDNGKANDNMLMHILSPYERHHSALTDCEKLTRSGFPSKRAILIYAFDDKDWPVSPAIDAFEEIARQRVMLGPRRTAAFRGLVHPVHQYGAVFGWEVS